MNHVTYRISPVPPFRLDYTVWALRRRPDNLIDRWDGQTYRRAWLLDGQVILTQVNQEGTEMEPQLLVTAAGELPAKRLHSITLAALEKVLGSRIDLTAFYTFAAQDPHLSSLIQQFRGVKPPRFPTLFEALINSISCQQISLNICVRLMNRMVEAWGTPISASEEQVWAFPQPEQLMKAEPEDFRKMGYSYNKARAILEMAGLIVRGELDLDAISSMDDDAAINSLMKLRGVGRWTAEYSLLRGDGRLHLFPPGDSGALGNLRKWLSPEREISHPELADILASWSPWAGLVYFHLLLRKLSELGYLK